MRAMAKINLPHVQVFTDRHGKQRAYYRKKGCPRKALPGKLGSAQFMAAYHEAGGNSPEQVGSGHTLPRTINALIVAYYNSPGFRRLRPSTRAVYRGTLERLRKACGDLPADRLSPDHIDGMLSLMADTPSAANNLRKRLRALMALAVKLKWRRDNPARETEALPTGRDGIPAWSDDDIIAFEARWPSGSRQRLALALLLYTGQRRSDVVRMGRQHVRDGRIAVTQVKTGAKLQIRIHPALQAELDQAPLGMTFLVTQYGAPFSAAGFTNWFKEQARKAAVAKSPHGLRKAAGRRLAEAGCTAKQIMAVLGHSSLAEAERYTKSASQVLLADDAIAQQLRAGT